jgi:hypothetical protein
MNAVYVVHIIRNTIVSKMAVGNNNHYVFDKAYKQLITIYYHVSLSNSSIALGVCLWRFIFSIKYILQVPLDRFSF